jgi:hypothetical protein
MLKHEDWPGLEKLTAVRRLMREGAMRTVSVLTGNGGVFLDFELERAEVSYLLARPAKRDARAKGLGL